MSLLSSLLPQSTTGSKVHTKSVFDNGYISTSKANGFRDDLDSGDSRAKAYFKLSEAALSSVLNTGGLSTADAQQLAEDDFWQLIVTNFSETHSEFSSAHNTLSEAYVWFATGPSPIAIQITGMLLAERDYDYRTRFLFLYAAALRARQLTLNERTLQFVLKDTCMHLVVTQLSFSESVKNPDYSVVTISGLAYKYCNMNSSEPLYTDFYGTEPDVPTFKVPPEEPKQEKEEPRADKGEGKV